MDLVILGTGAIGSVLAVHARAADPACHHAIHLVGRRARLEPIAREGLRYAPYGVTAPAQFTRTTGYEIHADVREVDRADVVFCTVKAHQLQAALTQAAHLWQAPGASHPVLVLAMNGLGLPGVARACGVARLVETSVVFPSRLEGNVVRNTGGNAFFVVEDTPLAHETLDPVFAGSALDLRFDPAFRRAQWKKAFMNVGMNALSAVTMLRVGEVLEREALGAIIKQLLHEALAVAGALGTPFDAAEIVAMFWDLAGKDPTHETSTLQDVRAHKPTEVDFLNGYIVRQGTRLGIPTPANAALVELVHVVESAYLAHAENRVVSRTSGRK